MVGGLVNVKHEITALSNTWHAHGIANAAKKFGPRSRRVSCLPHAVIRRTSEIAAFSIFPDLRCIPYEMQNP